MLHRLNETTTHTRLRHSKSASSPLRPGNSPRHDSLRHAQTAAEIAFGRAHPAPAPASTTVSSNSVEKRPATIRRVKSVRYAGPRAVDAPQVSITRRQASSWDELERNANLAAAKPSATSSEDFGDMLTALPNFRHRPPQPLPPRKLRKSRSMYPASSASWRLGLRKAGTDAMGDASPGSTNSKTPTLRRARSVLSRRPSRLDMSFGLSEADQEQAIQKARNEYQRQLETQELRKQQSMPLLSTLQRAGKPLRKTLRSVSGNSFGPAVSSHPTSDLDTGRLSTMSTTLRSMSSTVRGRMLKALHGPSDANSQLPSQQIDAQRLHFGNFSSDEPDTSWLAPRSTSSVFAEEQRDPNALFSSQATAPTSDSLDFRPDSSIRGSESNASRSRVTSWTNSTFTEVTNRFMPGRLTRLSVIRESSSPSKPSGPSDRLSSRAKRAYELFRRPLRSNTDQTQRPVDSQDVYSALQKRLSEIEQLRASNASACTSIDQAPHSVSVPPPIFEPAMHNLEQSEAAPPALAQLSEDTPVSLSRPGTVLWHHEKMPPPNDREADEVKSQHRYVADIERNNPMLMRESKSGLFSGTRSYYASTPSPFRQTLQQRRQARDLNALYSTTAGDDFVRRSFISDTSYGQRTDDTRSLYSAVAEAPPRETSLFPLQRNLGVTTPAATSDVAAVMQTVEDYSTTDHLSASANRQLSNSSRHVREKAQICDDETDANLRPNAYGFSETTAGAQQIWAPPHDDALRPAPLKVRPPLLERDPQHPGPIKALSNRRVSMSRPAMANIENQPRILPLKLASPSLSSPSAPVTPLKTLDRPASSQSQWDRAVRDTPSRHSPERIARLRRLQSQGILGSTTNRYGQMGSGSLSVSHRHNQMGSGSLTAAHRHDAGCAEILNGHGGKQRAVTSASSSPGVNGPSSTLVENFLSSRREQRAPSPMGPAFI